jgi:glycosyltransferase involved in cell wall biosynthesis
MTISVEPPSSSESPPPETALGASWRAEQEQAQEAIMPTGRVALSCPTTPGAGGLGRHFDEIRGALTRVGDTPIALTEADPKRPIERALARTLPPIGRISPAVRMWAASAAFDAGAARRLPRAEHLIAFNGTALNQLERARELGYGSRALVSANSHFAHLLRRHEQAYRQYPIERPWASRLLARNLREYELAEQIQVSSRYVWDSFLEQGVPESRLVRFPLTPDPRFVPAAAAAKSTTFDIVYVGSLTVHKGVPLLVDAVRRLPFSDLRLILVGGWGTRGMRRFIERAGLEDPRISARPGDPLARLQSARLCVHPAYEDGFAYAPAEALACRVPVIVSEDTGMKELIQDPAHGLVVPTGDLEVLTEAIESAYRAEHLDG